MCIFNTKFVFNILIRSYYLGDQNSFFHPVITYHTYFNHPIDCCKKREELESYQTIIYQVFNYGMKNVLLYGMIYIYKSSKCRYQRGSWIAQQIKKIKKQHTKNFKM